MFKQCFKCGALAPRNPEFFNRDKNKSDGLSPYCKTCSRSMRMARHIHTTERRKGVVRYTLAERKKRYKERHPDRVKASYAAPKKRAYMVRYMTKKYKTDPAYQMRARLSNRIRKALIGRKPATTMQLVGCTSEELKDWLELWFAPGMSWENRSEWEVDHRRPLASFDLSDPVQIKLACHYTNLQPLWRHENRAKGAKWSG